MHSPRAGRPRSRRRRRSETRAHSCRGAPQRPRARQHHRAHMQHPSRCNVVELESLDLRPVRGRRRAAPRAAARFPTRRRRWSRPALESALQDPAPLEVRSVERAASASRIRSLIRWTVLRAEPLRTAARKRIRYAARVGLEPLLIPGDLRFADQFAEALFFVADVGGELLRRAPIGSAPSASRLVLTSGCASAFTSSALVSRRFPAASPPARARRTMSSLRSRAGPIRDRRKVRHRRAARRFRHCRLALDCMSIGSCWRMPLKRIGERGANSLARARAMSRPSSRSTSRGEMGRLPCFERS